MRAQAPGYAHVPAWNMQQLTIFARLMCIFSIPLRLAEARRMILLYGMQLAFRNLSG